MTALSGRKALITGANRGIGRGVALAFAEAGADVAVNYPEAGAREEAMAVAQEITKRGRRGIAVEGDVSDEAAVAAMVAEVTDTFGGIDTLVNNAGIATSAPVEDMPAEMWDRVMAVHLRGTFLCTRAVLPAMYARNFGAIINTASQLAYKGAPGFSHYTAAKGAILSFTRSLALEIGKREIWANCVAPGATMTPMLEDVPADMLEAIRQSIPRGKLAEIDEIVPAYLFLASEQARHFRGQCLSPNGGDVFL